MNVNDIILEAKSLLTPNAGIEALVKCDCCIMDETCEPHPYKEEGCCPDWKRCDDPEYMLACLASRNPEQISEWVVDVYNAAIKTDKTRIYREVQFMAAIDSGALLKVNGKFINKNGKLFTSISDLGFDLKKVQGELSDCIGDSFNVCAGDEKLLLAFYRGYFYVISDGIVVQTVIYDPFISENIYVNGVNIKVSHLEPTIQREKYKHITWEKFVKSNWNDATGKEKLSELENGTQQYKKFLRRIKKSRRYREYKYRTDRWIVEWEYRGNKYEVIFGEGIDPDIEIWNRIKHDAYDFTEREVEIIDSWFSE